MNEDNEKNVNTENTEHSDKRSMDIFEIIAKYKGNLNFNAMSRLGHIPSPGKKLSNRELFFDMISDYRKKKYHLISLSTILALIGSVIYVLFPYDVMPDSMGVVGFLDDIVVIAFALHTGYDELCAYKLWLVTRDLSVKQAQKIIDQVMNEFNEKS